MEDNFLKNIDKEILSKVSNDGADFLDDFLQEEGYDLSEINSISTTCFKQQSFLLRSKLNLEKDNMLLEKVADQLFNVINNNLDRPISYLKELILNNKLGVQYRNLDKLSKEDITDMIKDQNLLEILEKIQNDDKS